MNSRVQDDENQERRPEEEGPPRAAAEEPLDESPETLALSQQALLALINSTGDLIWTVDPRSFGLLTFNNGLRDYFAARGIDLRTGMTPDDLLPPDFAERWHGFYRRALRDGPFVEQYLTASGRPVLLLSLNLVKTAGSVSAISVFGKDITERIESEEALRRSEQRFRTLIEDAPVAIRLSRSGRTLYANQRYLALFGYQHAADLEGHPILEQWAPEFRDEFARAVGAYESGMDVPRAYEGVALRKDGTRFRAHAAVGPVQLPDGPALIAYVADVTERWENEQAVRALTGRLIDAQEAERARLARELHDDFSQRLALLAVNLHLLRQSLPETPDRLRASVKGLHAHVQELARDLRQMSHDLHPARLEQLGLVSAVRGLCADLSAAHGLAIRCDAREVPADLPTDVAVCLYRVAQEALQNVIRHSGTGLAFVQLSGTGGELHLAVTDDGRGFDPGTRRRKDALGLVSMRERIRSISGEISIESGPGKGTRVEVRVPLELTKNG